MPKLVFCLMGPTAAGKTSLACELLNHFPVELISVDSALIYRGMNIGTAKPSLAELKKFPHHLIDIKNPIESYSAAEFCSDALALCETIFKKGKIPVLVGGTMMYFNSLQQGLSILPEANEQVRAAIEQEAQRYGWEHLHQQLMRVDAATAQRIHAHDAQRIQRALEVYQLSGIPLSTFQREHKKVPDYQFVNFALFPQQRVWLHERIASRFDEMLHLGFIDEVRQLKNHWPLESSMPAMRCVGYRQIFEYLEGAYPYEDLREKGIAATRQLAKRQLTWLRNWQGALYYDPQKPSFNEEIIAKIKEILDNNLS
ncbi:tRNA (adenosine(37)-N6)-dimethylallyltransferase MiaA [Legionella sp. km772]|uniref:tRNA (adenosine(37)-N6)-dimethylallyltransferase MiaA n=1 Tax=Legionella sp. km772 TaxID=2498111 RepID=UPI000F8E84B9|nr:tRNA (adenosine(37)-N6)-dimethylallyltransferase MiaA [Legionella sp. km772]RUR12545.1 tRNA (adenosine(37)-N6)-dimethylallyltransferase MiaA [Legionella sp. km772]